jgi:hypothetical protein
MSIVAVWLNTEFEANPTIWAVADTRYSGPGATESSRTIITDYGPKLFEVQIVVAVPSASGLYDRIVHYQKIGVGFVGSAVAALCIYTAAERILSHLANNNAEIPTVGQVHNCIERIAGSYVTPIANRNRVSFCTIGYCSSAKENQVFLTEIGSDAISHSRKVDLTTEKILLMGSHKVEIDIKIKEKEEEMSKWSGPINLNRAPLRAIRDIVKDGVFLDIGGDVDVGILNGGQFIIHANLKAIEPSGSSRNVTLVTAGHDIIGGIGNVGPCFVNIVGMA